MVNLFLIISGIGALQCLLFILLLLIKKDKRQPDHILIVWFFLFLIHLVISIIDEVTPSRTTEILIMTIGLLQGPLFLAYTLTLFSFSFSRTLTLHAIPFILLTIISFYILPNDELKWEIFILIIKVISLSIYPIYILYLCQKREETQQGNRPTISKHTLSWIRIIAILFLVSIGISIVRLSVELIVGVAYFELWDLIRYIILVTVIGFYGLKYGMVYKPEVSQETALDPKKYRHSPLQEKEILHYQHRINDFFDENKAYLQPDFSLASLSEAVDIPKHHLSQII
ncbi:MAG: hypothetical protein AAF388_16425, partial [Bacteroidota bacterium]